MFNPHVRFTICTRLLFHTQYLYNGLPIRHCISQWETDHVNPRRHSQSELPGGMGVEVKGGELRLLLWKEGSIVGEKWVSASTPERSIWDLLTIVNTEA